MTSMSRTRPVPSGGFTDMVLTKAGFAPRSDARIPKVPVDRDMHGLPDFQIDARRNCRRMRDLGFFAIDVGRARDTNDTAGRACQRAGVAGLPARCGVEDGAIENDAAGLRQGNHGGAALLEIGILAEKTIGGHQVARVCSSASSFLVRHLDMR